MIYNKVIDYITEEVQMLSAGFQCVISFEKIECRFKVPELFNEEIEYIKVLLEERNQVASVDITECGFDVVLYTGYAPSYTEQMGINI